VINPNNPTGAVYGARFLAGSIVEIARQHNLIIFADEIYDKILYDDATAHSVSQPGRRPCCASPSTACPRPTAWPASAPGWMIISGAKHRASGFIEGLEILASMRLCANVPAQHAIQTALGGYQSINELILPGGRLREQRDKAWELINAIPGVSCVKPKGALYLFPASTRRSTTSSTTRRWCSTCCSRRRCCWCRAPAFNWPDPDHFRATPRRRRNAS
jgi:alanine-synthesizing transaminase